MTLDTSKFISGVRAARYYKKQVLEDSAVPDKFQVLMTGRKAFMRDQIIMETDDVYIVSPIRFNNRSNDLIAVNMDSGWSLLTDFLDQTRYGRPSNTNDLVRPGFGVEPIAMSDVDRALNVLQDMGRWDIAFRLVANLVGLAGVRPDDIRWEKFPHKSKMLLMTSKNTGLFLTGAMKDVVEKWWAYTGGWHNPCAFIYMPDDKEYREFMNGLRNPFVLAGVNREAAREVIEQNLHPVESTFPDLTEADLAGRDFWVHRGVIYLADTEGSVLPYWFGTASGPEPERVGWDESTRKLLAGHMNLPLLVQRTVEKALKASTIL